MGDFTGIEFAAGEVRGTRAFKVDKEGRLRGVVYETIWRPGENIAQCLRGIPPDAVKPGARSQRTGGGVNFGVGTGGQSSFRGVAAPGGSGGVVSSSLMRAAAGFASMMNPQVCPCGCGQLIGTTDEDDYRPLKCNGMEPTCSCGFYVYQRGSNDFYSPDGKVGQAGSIGGVVRGYGKVVLCSRGFRAEKAEILALYVDPDFGNRLTAALYRRRLGRNYDVPVFEDYLKMLDEFPVDDPEPDDDFWEAS